MLFTDMDGNLGATCIGPAKHEDSFCETYTCGHPLDESNHNFDSVWEFVRACEDTAHDAYINDEDCQEGLAEHLGFEDYDALVWAAKEGDFK